jgi:hypothetical protein
MVDLGLEAHDGALEGEVIQFELDLELSALEGGGFGASDVDAPDSVLIGDDGVTSG